ncbi:MAG: NPCBM/NEW2 domain-containing protein, partial [Sedimentisphaerales bacterium]|nr:NPCBM/NEW2 domain-containing protein [Sedimentisphaerales bacterium]
DYGTEFGITADRKGNTQAHVFLGKVELINGSDPTIATARQALNGGQACMVKDGVLSDKITPAKPETFIRSLPERQTFGMPGCMVDLADLVGGGSGFSSSQQCISIDPGTGKISSEIMFDHRNTSEYAYNILPELNCVDGVFVPRGSDQPHIISSAGHTFKDCPDTCDYYWTDITNRPITCTDSYYVKNRTVSPVKYNNVEYGTAMNPAICMHANVGITFDLDEIRAMNPGTRITGFTALCALSDTLKSTKYFDNQKAEMWILVDGQTIHNIQIDSARSTSALIEMAISDDDKFLTLVSTDGGDYNNGDWTFFGNAGLILEQN